MRKFISKIKGIGLLELMLSLAIIAILLVMATRYYSATTRSQRVDDTIQLLGEVETAVNSALSNGDVTKYSLLTDPSLLVTNGYLSQARVTSDKKSIKSPWGDVVAWSAADNTGVELTFSNVPDQQCKDLGKKFYGDATGSASTGGCVSGSGTTGSTFYYYIH